MLWASGHYTLPILREIAEAAPSAELRPIAEGNRTNQYTLSYTLSSPTFDRTLTTLSLILPYPKHTLSLSYLTYLYFNSIYLSLLHFTISLI